jgi:hypothetical protein
MKSLFNGTCDLCSHFRPGCAYIFLKLTIGQATRFRRRPTIACKECRGLNKGRFRYGENHR